MSTVADNIEEMLDREPLVLSSGAHCDIVNPHAAALLKSEVFVVFPDGERWAHVPLLHIASIEALASGRGRRNGRKPGRG